MSDPTSHRFPCRGAAVALALALAVLGCSGHRIHSQAQQAELSGDWDQAVLHYLEALRLDPQNLGYRASLMRAKIQASQEHFRKGQQFHDAGALERSLMEYRQAVQLDPANQWAAAELARVADELAALRDNGSRPGSIAEMKERARTAPASQPPILNPRSKEPIDLLFSEPTSTRDIYQAMGDAFGINIVFDPKLRDQEIEIELQQVTAQNALETVMRTAGHFYKVIDEGTILIADDTPQNRRTYEDHIIQTFFLDNADVKEVMTMVRSLISAKNVAPNEPLNAIVMRDTADRVKVAEQIILANDKAKAEVVVDIELLQINSSRLRELGLELSQYSVGVDLDLGGDDVPIRFSDLEYLNENNWLLSLPDFAVNLVKNSGDAQTLAQPKLRITEGEKASLVIGDRVPIPTTTFNTSTTVGSNVVPVTSFQYQDVGIKIDIEPRVHHNEEVTLKLKVEVSNIADFVSGSGGQEQPIIGTRTIESSIRLQDGETNFLAGLIRTDESQSEQGVPGLSEIPILGRLFKNNSTDRRRTDIVLTLTPHIIRRAAITEADLLPIWVGTENNITFRGGSSRIESDVAGPFDGDSEDARERVRERLQERLRSLPRGLQEVDEGGELVEGFEDPEEPVEPPSGVDLAPTGGYSDPFGDDDLDDDGE